jgi:hypothetical protein
MTDTVNAQHAVADARRKGGLLGVIVELKKRRRVGAGSLERRHAAIESDLDREQKRPLPDFVRVKRLKQLKLRIKDALVATRREQGVGA